MRYKKALIVSIFLPFHHQTTFNPSNSQSQVTQSIPQNLSANSEHGKPKMHPYDQAYGEMTRTLPEPYRSRYGHTCEGTYSVLICGHITPVQVNRHPGCYKCSEALPSLCQPSYPVLVHSSHRCARCQAEYERKARERECRRY